MKKIMLPLRRHINSYSIRRQLAILLLLGLLPAFLLGYYFITRSNEAIAIVDRELAGAEMLTEMLPAAEYIYNIPEDPDERVAGAKKALGHVEEALSHGGHAREFAVEKRGEALARQLKVLAAGGESNPQWALSRLMRRIGDNSGLNLDAELDSAYLARIMIDHVPQLNKSAGQLRDTFRVEEGARNPLVVLARHRVADDTKALQQAFTSAEKGDPGLSSANSEVLKNINAVITKSNSFVAGKDAEADYQALVGANHNAWLVVSNQLQKSLRIRRDQISKRLFSALSICLAAIMLVVAFSILMISGLSSGLGRIRERLDRLSDGDYESAVPGTMVENDIGVIAGALQDFIYSSYELEQQKAESQAVLERTVAEVKRENDQLLAEQLEQQAKQAEAERLATLRLANELEEKVAGLLSNSRSATMQLDGEANAMAESSSKIKRSSEQAASVAVQVRDNVEHIKPVVAEVSDQLASYSETLREARNLADNAVSRVNDAKGRITEFEQATGHVDSMLSLITSIAHKTNMLALNASIEAARVGAAGEGFKVVADEVKSLASSTAATAKDISSQVEAMKDVNSAVVGSFGDILEVVSQLAGESVAVTTGMQEQKQSIASVASIVEDTSSELANMAHDVSDADSAASKAQVQSNEMLGASRHVAENVVELDNAVQAFLSELKSGSSDIKAA